MATVTTFRNDVLPQVDTDVENVVRSLALTNGVAANGDQISVIGIAPGNRGRLVGAVVRTSATLGAGATLQARVNRSGVFTNITAATTAGAASKVDDSAQAGVPFDLQAGDIIELLVGGANITAAATATVDLLIAGKSGS